MSQADITTKAKQLLARRQAPNSPWFYLSRDWRRQVVFILAYIAIPIASWSMNLRLLAVAMACFFIGAKIRDVRWWFALSKEWPTTSKLIDWDKVEAIANGDAEK